MNRGVRWGAIAAMVAMMALVGVVAYNAGVSQGLVESARVVAPAVPGAPGAPGAVAPYVYYYPRHWGWGFGAGPFLVLFWVFLMFALIRRAFWGPRWYRRGYGCYGGYYDRVPPEFDEWHRRAHGQQEPTKL